MHNFVHAFPDSNIFLHYPPLSELDWCRICDAKAVTLVVCLPVIHELDHKKSDSRLGGRAERAVKQLREIYATDGVIREGVTLAVYNQELRLEEFPASLSPDSNDDRIVHLVEKYIAANPGLAVAVVTEDFGMELRCEAHSVPVIRVDTSLRLENPQDELTKKYRRAITELNDLKNRLPTFTLQAVPPGVEPATEAPFQCELADAWQPFDVQAEVAKQQQAHPKHSAAAMSMTAMIPTFVSNDEWRRYNEKLDGYYLNYKLYLQQLNTWAQNNARTIEFDLWLGNVGSCPAEDVDVLLLLPGKLKWVAEKESEIAKPLLRPRPPKPPEKPEPRWPFSLSIPTFLPVTPIAHQIERLLEERKRNKVEVINRGEHGFCIHAKLERLKHGQRHKLGSFLGVFSDWNQVSPFEAEYTITTSEIPNKITGKLPFIVRAAGSKK
jgi:hypothetical protein